MTLVEMIWGCRAIKGMDRLVLMAWAAQLEEGNDTAYAAKTTVATFLGVSEDTIKRRTKSLLKAGWLVDTAERKQWEPDCWTPVYRINVEKFAEFESGGAKCTHGAKRAGVQNAPQGSGSGSGSGFDSLPLTTAGATSHLTDLRSVRKIKAPPQEQTRQNPKTENRKPKVKTCPKCSGELYRDKNHKCSLLATKADDLMHLCIICQENSCRTDTSDYCLSCWEVKCGSKVNPNPPPRLQTFEDDDDWEVECVAKANPTPRPPMQTFADDDEDTVARPNPLTKQKER